MPAVPLNRGNAWEFWKTGRIAATNIENLSIDAPNTPSMLRNLAIKHGYNAIRLWFTWAVGNQTKEYSVLGPDWITIGNKGWADTSLTFRTRNSGASGTRINEVAQQVQRVLDICESLGVGVILTGNFYSGKTNGETVDGRLWVDNDAPNDEFGYAIGQTKASEMQDALIRFWQETLRTFGQHKALIALDLLNEPKPPILANLGLARHTSQHLDAWAPLAAKLVKALRSKDPSAAPGSTLPRIPYIISEDMSYGLRPFLSTARSSDDGCSYLDMNINTSYLVRDCTSAGAPYSSLADDRIVYTFHTYRPLDFTQQGVLDETYCALGVTYPPNGWTREDVAHEAKADTVPTMQNFRTAAGWDKVFEQAIAMKNLGVPVFMGEFGAVEPNLNQVYPPKSGREALKQDVSNVKALTLEASTLPSDLNKYRRITQIDVSQDGKTYTFTMGDVREWAQLMTSVDESIPEVLNGQGIGSQNYPKDGLVCHLDSQKSAVFLDAGNWNAEWYRNDHAKATVHLYVNGAWLMTPLFQDVMITLCNTGDGTSSGTGSLSFTVPVSQITGAKDQIQNATGTVKAALTIKTGRSPEDVSAARLAFTKDALRLCQRNGFSWAHFNEANDGPGFVGWRPTPAMREALSKAARGEKV